MVTLKKSGEYFDLDIHCEETIDENVKLSITNDELKLDIKVIGQNYHEALWNLYTELESIEIELKCNGVSLNVYPSPMQFDMGLAYQGLQLKMGIRNNDNVVLIDYNIDKFIKCNKAEQLAFYNKWILSKKKEKLKTQEIFIDSISPKHYFYFSGGINPIILKLQSHVLVNGGHVLLIMKV